MKLELALAVLILALALLFAYFSSGTPNFFATASPQNLLPVRETGVESSIREHEFQKISLYAGGSSGFSTYIKNAKIGMGTCAPFVAECYVGENTVAAMLPDGKIDAMVGYFARVPSDCEIILSGESAADLSGMRLSAGWNHLGAPAQPAKAIDALSGCEIESFMLFDSKAHAYVDADTFYPGGAYWAKVASDCTVSG
jgi:hypothetical protein